MLPSLTKPYNQNIAYHSSLKNSTPKQDQKLRLSQQPKVYQPQFSNNNNNNNNRNLNSNINQNSVSSSSFVFSTKKIRTAKDFKKDKNDGSDNIYGGNFGNYQQNSQGNKRSQQNWRKNQTVSQPHTKISTGQKQRQFMKGPVYVKKDFNTLNPYQNNNLSQQIKLIQKKIRQCQKKIQLQKKKAQQQLQKQNGNSSNQYDFQRVIRRELQIQKNQRIKMGIYDQNQIEVQNKGFDYLTNPGKAKQQQQNKQQQEIVVVEQETLQPQQYNINQGIQKLQKHYQNSLKKKFQRRQMFPHQACKRKTPKLYITQKHNALKKQGRALTDEQHMFRVMTKQVTPQEIYPTIPNFAVVKDNLSKNIVAYLGDYKPFVEKTRQNRDDMNINQNNNLSSMNIKSNNQIDGNQKSKSGSFNTNNLKKQNQKDQILQGQKQQQFQLKQVKGSSLRGSRNQSKKFNKSDRLAKQQLLQKQKSIQKQKNSQIQINEPISLTFVQQKN